MDLSIDGSTEHKLSHPACNTEVLKVCPYYIQALPVEFDPVRNEAPGFTLVLRVPTAPGLPCAPKRTAFIYALLGSKATVPRLNKTNHSVRGAHSLPHLVSSFILHALVLTHLFFGEDILQCVVRIGANCL